LQCTCVTEEPSPTLTRNPSPKPSDSTVSPTFSPTSSPTSSPTYYPSEQPSFGPTQTPSSFPSDSPSLIPTVCGGNPIQRAAKLNEIISNVSLAVDLQNTTSPQSMARDWLINKDTYRECPVENECRLSQRYVMAVLYFATNGDIAWNSCGRNSTKSSCVKTDPTNDSMALSVVQRASNETWLSSVDECLWGGLACNDNTGCMDRIEFESNNLEGSIPFELEQLRELRYLLLEGKIGKNDNKSSKFLSGTIPSQVGNLPNLLKLDLNFNELSGTLPTTIHSLTNLIELDLDNNKLSGSISPLIGNNVNLEFIQLDFNQFNSSIPTEIGKLTSLEKLSLIVNEFSSVIPDEIERITSLQLLRICGTNITALSTKVCNLPDLKTLNANQDVCENFSLVCSSKQCNSQCQE